MTDRDARAEVATELGSRAVQEPRSGILIGYARRSTEKQDLSAQREILRGLGVTEERVCLDHGLTGTNRSGLGLNNVLEDLGYGLGESGYCLAVGAAPSASIGSLAGLLEDPAVLGNGLGTHPHPLLGNRVLRDDDLVFVQHDLALLLGARDPRSPDRRWRRRSAHARSGPPRAAPERSG